MIFNFRPESFFHCDMNFKHKVQDMNFFIRLRENLHLHTAEFSIRSQTPYSHVMFYIHIHNEACNGLYLPLHNRCLARYNICLMEIHLFVIRNFHINVNVVYVKYEK